MAHFACIDENNVVTNVIVVSNFDCLGEDGRESEKTGADFCNRLFGGKWIQTSYNSTIRGRFAGIGFMYLEENDVFVAPSPGPEYVLNENYEWIKQ